MTVRPRLLALATALLTLAAAAPASAGHKPSHDPPGRSRAQQPATAGAPTDYRKVEGLSQPDYPQTVRETHRVPMADGNHLYVEVVRPAPAAHGEGPWPVIMEASPYHGTLADRDGIRIFPDPVDDAGKPIGLTGYFAPRGYAVAMVDLRGTGRSEGCLDHLGRKDASDLKTIVEWAADQPWSTGRVGLTGHSYVGSTPSVAAAQRPEGLATIVPSAGLASMYDHQFQSGVPYLLQWAGPQWAYEELALGRDLPPVARDPLLDYPWGDNFGNRPDQTGCGLPNSALTAGHGQVTGEYQAWHAQRDWREGATVADVPVFIVHGVNDDAARIPSAEWFFGARFDRPGDKVWLGQWDHGSGAHLNRRYDQWKWALHAWFDRHLQGRDVDTGPPVEAFLNDGRVYTDTSWKHPSAWLNLYPDATSGGLASAAPGGPGAASYTATPTDAAGRIEFASEPLPEDVLLLGLPRLRLHASLSAAQALNLIGTLERQDAEGNRHPMSYCALQPQLRYGLSTPAPIVPGEEMQLDLQCFTMAHRLAQGERIVLAVGTHSPHHVPTFTSDVQVTVHTGPGRSAVALPAVPDATTYEDVPLYDRYDTLREGPAQPTIATSTTVPAPGVGVRVGGVTRTFTEFTVEEGHSKLTVLAVPTPQPADVDLYLSRKLGDGSWQQVAAGTSGSTEQEELELAVPLAGDYRLEVHNWLGAPALEVDLTITFYNKAGEPGPDPG